MNKPDWSKAPEGATHWGPKNEAFHACWYRKKDGIWYACRPSNPTWRAHCYMDGERLAQLIVHRRPEPVAWDGEGLPPVGVPIESKHKQSTTEWASPGFNETVIVAMGQHLAIFTHPGSDREKVGRIEDYDFRPISTPEQKAAQERERAVRKMRDIHDDAAMVAADGFGALYDAGYRKTGGGS